MKIFVVSNSLIFKNIIREIFISNDSKIKVDEVSNWTFVIDKLDELNPDVLISDIKPISFDTLLSMNTNIVFVTKEKIDLIGLNLFHIPKPELMQLNDLDYRKVFYDKIINIIKQNVNRKSSPNITVPKYNTKSIYNKYKVLMIGASTGGPIAVAKVLKGLNYSFPLGIILVQHIETGFDSSYAEWLSIETSWNVRLAKNNDFPSKHEAILAPTDQHIIFKGKRIYLDDGPKVLNQKPSVDVLFESAAMVWGDELIAVLLTGMGTDGAIGCVKIKNQGGLTIVQNKETSTIFGMPKAAIDKGGASHILSLEEIPKFLEKIVQ